MSNTHVVYGLQLVFREATYHMKLLVEGMFNFNLRCNDEFDKDRNIPQSNLSEE